MGLNKKDIEYRDNQRVRIKIRSFVAILTGLFANWIWLFIIILLFIIGELFTMYKVLSHSFSSNEKLELNLQQKGETFGKSLAAALLAGLSTLALACIIKLIRNFILSLF